MLCVALAGCANPLNRVTSDRYADTCAATERAGRLDVADSGKSALAMQFRERAERL